MTVEDRSSAGIVVREYAESDEAAVLELLQASLGGGPVGSRSPGLFRWTHFENPFGRTFMLVAEARGRLIGLRAFMRWKFTAEGQGLSAVRAVDTATHPDFQGRGVFRRLTLEALDALRGDVDLVFNTPNAQSLPGYLKMGWSVVGRIPISIKVRRPIRFVRGLHRIDEPSDGSRQASPVGGAPASTLLVERRKLDDLLSRMRPAGDRISTPRSTEYVCWRYATAPDLGYRVIRHADGQGVLQGIAIYRSRLRGPLLETTLSEVLAPDSERAVIGSLLRRVARAEEVDHVAAHFAPGSVSAGAAPLHGFVRVPQGMTLVVNALQSRIRPNPFELRSWALALGDVEVF
jgi:GNAT superfamily N-acetyltransferase